MSSCLFQYRLGFAKYLHGVFLRKKGIRVNWQYVVNAQVYQQSIRLQRRLKGLCSVCFSTFTIPCNCTLLCFFAKSLNKQVQMFTGLKLVEPFYCLSYILQIYTTNWFFSCKDLVSKCSRGMQYSSKIYFT